MNRYATIEKLRNTNEFVGTQGTQYYNITQYPEVPTNENDIWVETDFGDRLDLLANQFYGDVTLYWIISIANPNSLNLGSITIPPGTQLRIPVNINGIVSRFNQLNAL